MRLGLGSDLKNCSISFLDAKASDVLIFDFLKGFMIFSDSIDKSRARMHMRMQRRMRTHVRSSWLSTFPEDYKRAISQDRFTSHPERSCGSKSKA